MNSVPVVLGSESPRRRRILRSLGVAFETVTPGVDEAHDAADPVATVIDNALAKHRAVRRLRPDACLITSDTLVWFQGELVGKPADPDEAAAMLRRFSGGSQVVITAVAMSMPGESPDTRVAASSVRFRQLTETAIHDYIRRARPFDRAGAYDIDENGHLLVESYAGSYTNVMGLPRGVVADWLRARRIIDNPPGSPYAD